MKKVFEYWMPDTDSHFERLIAKRVKKGGPPQYQDDTRAEAYKHVKDFDIAIDVGANVGLWAKHLVEKFNRVIAFEPLEQVYSCLELNCENLPVELNKHALGSTNDKVTMTYDSENTGGSFVKEVGQGTIDIKTLDSLNLPKFGLLKIDCEGHELEVVKGGKDTILKYNPIIIVEQHPESKYQAADYLRELGAVSLGNVRKDYIFGWK
jgi:FkbM family methyltransferase|tara:strand:- start:167 stop:790 length:624 start_codon:yes stop_codon:yes gene_type:complete